MKISHNFMSSLAQLPVVAHDTNTFQIWDDYLLEKSAANKWFLTNRVTHEFALVSSMLLGTFVQQLTSA